LSLILFKHIRQCIAMPFPREHPLAVKKKRCTRSTTGEDGPEDGEVAARIEEKARIQRAQARFSYDEAVARKAAKRVSPVSLTLIHFTASST
jgi:hypothetical protein